MGLIGLRGRRIRPISPIGPIRLPGTHVFERLQTLTGELSAVAEVKQWLRA